MKGQRQPKAAAIGKAKSKGRNWQAKTRAKTKCNDKGKGKDKVKDKGKARIKDNGKDTGQRKDNGKVMAESKDKGKSLFFQVFGRDLVTMHGEVEGESMVLVHGTDLTAFSGRNPDDFVNEAVQVDFVHGKPYEGFMKTNK